MPLEVALVRVQVQVQVVRVPEPVRVALRALPQERPALPQERPALPQEQQVPPPELRVLRLVRPLERRAARPVPQRLELPA